jgi:iron complex transport system permease protein
VSQPASTLRTASKRAGGRRSTLVFTVGAALLVVATLLSASIGQLAIPPSEVVGGLLHGMGITTPWAPESDITTQALWQIRFPRVVASILVGAALAVAGAVMQAVFGNPLAEPGVVGVSSGAALGAALGIVIGGAAATTFGIAGLAFVGGLAATALVYSMARQGGRTEVVTLLLTGIAVNAFAGAGLALLLFAGDTASREQIVFWQLGTLNGTRWNEVAVMAPLAVIGLVASLYFARKYDLLALGERTAGHLGLRVERLRIVSIVVVAVLTGAAVAFVGIIAFVGLVVPHVIRMILGPSHRRLILASALGGAVLLVFADAAARTAVEGADLPIGLLTSLIGGPFFFYLLRRTRQRAGGWM